MTIKTTNKDGSNSTLLSTRATTMETKKEHNRVEIQRILGALETIGDLLPTCIHQQAKGHRHIQVQHAKHIGLDGSA